MSSTVLVAMDALIAQLLPFRPFAEAVLVEKQRESHFLLAAAVYVTLCLRQKMVGSCSLQLNLIIDRISP